MAAPRKRPREIIDQASIAECPFNARWVDSKERDLKKKKRRKDDDPDDNNAKIPVQLSPFAPTGKFKTHETMDLPYMVDGPNGAKQKWLDMTRYNSFVLNSTKYFSDNYIFVANDSTIERQKAGQQPAPIAHSDSDWVARILEIRASDEHHVYARVFWMYWPDELPPNTLDGKKYVTGRQPYHGQAEVIASNHMDIINVVSVTQQAIVNQVTDENDDQIQQALYWRQALDIRVNELSSVDRVCKCNEPGNPDKVLIGCPNDKCGKWLHEECMKHAVLTKVYEELGTDKPHKAPSADVKDPKDEEVKRPLSPVEPASGTIANALPIQVKTDGGDKADAKPANDSVDVKQEREVEAEGSSSAPAQSGQASGSADVKKEETARKGGRPRKKAAEDLSARPYAGLFEATFNPDEDMFEVTDLRQVQGGEQTWLEKTYCLVCGASIDEQK